MRLWSLHPSYLDTKGLLAVWREGLLALHVLRGQTKGYTRHPQLLRFKNHPEPVKAITAYLHTVVDEADRRQFSFQRTKLEAIANNSIKKITVTTQQLQYEADHLRKKLAVRDPQRLKEFAALSQVEAHPLFTIIEGEVEVWEKL